MEKRTILKSQKNQVFADIIFNGLIPSQFQWVECPSLHTKGLVVSKLIHVPTGYYFIFDFNAGLHWSEFSPVFESYRRLELPVSLASQMEDVHKWLKCVKKELDTPDLWAAIIKESKLLEVESIQDIANTEFSAQEQKYISTQLEEMKRYFIATQELSNEKALFFETRLNYLVDASKRQGKKDWYFQAVGVLVNIAVNACFDPQRARELFRLAGQSLDTLFGGMLHLP